MIEAGTALTAQPTGRLIEVIDRFLPLGWLGFYLLLPVSGWAELMFTSWHDQERFVEALRSVLAEGRADDIADNIIGPAYIAAAALVHHVFALSPEDSLVALNRASYALSIAAGMAIVRVLVRRLAVPSPAVSLAGQFAFVALAFAAGTWYWSDVPWTHFFAACLAVLFYLSRLVRVNASFLSVALVGVGLALLWLTRSFEAVALLIAWAIALIALVVLRTSGWKPPRVAHLLTGAAALGVTASAVHLATGKRELFFLYSSSLDRQSAAVLPAEVAQTPTFSLAFVPVKVVQLFVEPCFYSMCAVTDYVGSAEPLSGPLVDSSGQERLWRMPLAVQLPSLVVLPLCVVAVLALVVWLTRHRITASGRVREIRLLVEMTIAASGIVLGYTASTLTGSSHLRYGFARDFLMPALLTGVVAISLGTVGLWLLLTRSGMVRLWPTRLRLSPEGGMMLAALVVAVAIGAAVWAGRSYGLPRIEGRHLGDVAYTARCEGDRCDVSIEARTTSGRPISIPEASTLTFGCGDDTARFTLYVRRPAEGVRLGQPCRDPRLVAAWPTVMGLPPGTYELRAVSVSNAARD